MYPWLLCIIIIIFCGIFVKKHLRKLELISKIYSTKKTLPVIGSAHIFAGDSESIMNSIKDISSECAANGDVMKFWLGPFLYLLLTGPTKIDEILKYHLEKDHSVAVLLSVFGNGTIFAPLSIWRRRRKAVNYAFNPKFVTNFFGIFLNHSKKIVDKIAAQVEDNVPFCVWPYLNSYNFDVAWESAIGNSTTSISDECKDSLLNSITILKNSISKRIFHFWLKPDFLFRFHADYAKVESHRKSCFEYIDENVEKRRDEYNDDEKEQGTLFDRILSFSKRDIPFNNLEMREELVTIFSAATETCTNAAYFILILLSKYPSVQEKVYEELHAAFHDQNMLPNNKEDLLKLEYLERVINEALRLYPPAPIIVRKTNKETSFPDGVTIPENTSILISIWGLHRNKKYWGQDADNFDPDRFLPARFTRIPPGCYLPFITGSRNCPGYSFAMMSLKTVLSVLLTRFRVVPDPEDGPAPHIRAKFEITMSPADDRVTLEKRC